MNYYNEHEPKAAAWLRELIKDGLIPNGEVDERYIQKVKGSDLAGFTQVHLFAGIGGWSEALRLAGWPADRPVWTGSAPCQDFSAAGKGEGHGGTRNLWPEMFRLIRECRPAVVFGEQVDAAIRYGWLDGVFVDLETLDYACGAAVLPAACVSAPHRRHRIYWMAIAECAERRPLVSNDERHGVEHSAGDGRPHGRGKPSDGPLESTPRAPQQRSGEIKLLGEPSSTRPQGQRERCDGVHEPRRNAAHPAGHGGQAGEADWNGETIFIECRDGKTRRVPLERAFQPLVDGIQPARVACLRGAGNAIVPQAAAEFIQAYLKIERK